jgi:hypothetical protein
VSSGTGGGWESPLVEKRRRARLGWISWPIMFAGFITMCVGVIATIVAIVTLASQDGTGWHGAALIAAVLIPAGLVAWVGGSHLGGTGSAWDVLLMMIEVGVGTLLNRVGIFCAGLGALSLIAGGPPGEAVPILAGGIVALGLSYGLQKLSLRVIDGMGAED